MERSRADLEIVSAFVIERIGEEAERSGAPLGDDEMHFLSHLPDKPTNPTAEWGFQTSYEGDSPTPVLRDLGFERLCNLAKGAGMGVCGCGVAGPSPSSFVATSVDWNPNRKAPCALGSFAARGHWYSRCRRFCSWRGRSVRPDRWHGGRSEVDVVGRERMCLRRVPHASLLRRAADRSPATRAAH